MPISLVFLFTVISCSTLWSIETLVNTTVNHTNSNGSQTQTRLLYSRVPSVECMRLFSFYNNRNYWIDLCDSNALLSPFLKRYTRAVCSPPSTRRSNVKYWILYSREGFRGRHIFVRPDTCITDMHRNGIRSVGSIMKCLRWSQYNINSHCNVPRQSSLITDEIPENIVEVNQELNPGIDTSNQFDLSTQQNDSANNNVIIP
ncbi:unnamed protein product [Schistosoma rodhaini]|uniref:Interleukin-4 inducing immunoglobulin-binding domain-containing protein n=2 Tax=Schistosoma rodhaini TaxID=6188 RepID=A0AA85FDQ6_9TREM|nr:unnamed protein product [Schistosoma rodhaini]